jgi:hypothetical protein
MNDATTSNERVRAWVAGWITAVLTIAASVAIAFGVAQGLGAADTEPFESPLMFSVARQLDQGPWGLYGPFGGQNPLVLIHAPLYYHLAAILGWPFERSGLDPITAARLAGRALSFVGLLITAWSAFCIARIDGAPARAGWWAACLIACAPVVAPMPYTVRPDMLGVALQTTGVLLILRALSSGRPGVVAIVGGFAAFGLAMCVKQHLVGGPVVATILLVWASWRGRVSLRVVGMGALTAAAIVAAVYGTEELATEGLMSQAIFTAAAATTRVHPTDWIRTAIVVGSIAGGSLCMTALFACAELALAASMSRTRRILVAVGIVLVGFALVMPVVNYFRATTIATLIWSQAVVGCFVVLIPAGVILERRAGLGGRLDAALCLFTVAELAIIVPLSRASTGAWVNYGIQGVVFAAILTARSMSRACSESRLPRTLIPIGAVVIALLSFELRDAYTSFHRRRADRLSVEMVLDWLKEPASSLYFVGAPGKNRQYGRTDLVFDHWLYPAFESVHAAEPRSAWLRRALADGAIRFVITTSEDPRIDGLDESLTDLGYAARVEIASLYVWERIQGPRRR